MGIVRGAWLDQLSLDTSKSLTAVTDTVAIVRASAVGFDQGYDGHVYSLAPGTTPFYPVLREGDPADGRDLEPSAARFAGAHADQIQVGGCANPAMAPLVKQFAVPGEEVAGARTGFGGHRAHRRDGGRRGR